MKRIVFSLSKLAALASCAIVFLSCASSTKDGSELEIKRFERELISIHIDSLEKELPRLKEEYPVYLGGVDISDSFNILSLQEFLLDPNVKELFEASQDYYKDNKILSKELSAIFSRAKELFADIVEPKVYTYISGLDYQNRIILQDSILSISLDLYLNDMSKTYQTLGFPMYISNRICPQNLFVEVSQAIAIKYLPQREEIGSLLDEMVYQGKIMLVIDYLLPKYAEYTKLMYTQEQWQWCKSNEKLVWQYWIDEHLLYEKDLLRIKNYINDGPSGIAFKDAPSRLAQYFGWRILNLYRNNVDIDIKDEAFWLSEGQNVLRIAKYKP